MSMIDKYCEAINQQNRIEKLVNLVLECKEEIEILKSKSEQEVELLKQLEKQQQQQQEKRQEEYWSYSTSGGVFTKLTASLDEIIQKLKIDHKQLTLEQLKQQIAKLKELQEQLKRVDPNDTYKIQQRYL